MAWRRLRTCSQPPPPRPLKLNGIQASVISPPSVRKSERFQLQPCWLNCVKSTRNCKFFKTHQNQHTTPPRDTCAYLSDSADKSEPTRMLDRHPHAHHGSIALGRGGALRCVSLRVRHPRPCHCRSWIARSCSKFATGRRERWGGTPARRACGGRGQARAFQCRWLWRAGLADGGPAPPGNGKFCSLASKVAHAHVSRMFRACLGRVCVRVCVCVCVCV